MGITIARSGLKKIENTYVGYNQHLNPEDKQLWRTSSHTIYSALATQLLTYSVDVMNFNKALVEKNLPLDISIPVVSNDTVERSFAHRRISPEKVSLSDPTFGIGLNEATLETLTGEKIPLQVFCNATKDEDFIGNKITGSSSDDKMRHVRSNFIPMVLKTLKNIVGASAVPNLKSVIFDFISNGHLAEGANAGIFILPNEHDPAKFELVITEEGVHGGSRRHYLHEICDDDLPFLENKIAVALLKMEHLTMT